MSTVNDLRNNILKKDSIGTHDWGDDTSWQNYEEGWPSGKDSSFIVEPVAGQAIIIPRARIRYSEDAIMHSPLKIDYYIGETVVDTTTYKNQDDFFDRFDSFEVFPTSGGNGYTADIWSHEYEFDEAIVLWSSVGAGKLNKMVIFIEDNEQYKKQDASAIEMARVRYLGCLICTDPDYVE